MPSSTCNQKDILIESKLNGILGGFVVSLGFRNFHMGGEVKCCKKILNSILMPVSICTQKEFFY